MTTNFPPFDAPTPEATEPAPPLVVVGIVTEQGVNMGDHGQDVSKAVIIDPEETVAALAARVLQKPEGWPSRLAPSGDLYLTLRVAVDR